VIGKDIYAAWDAKAAGAEAEKAWNTRYAAYKAAHPVLAREFARRMKGELPKGFDQTVVDTVLGAHAKAETVASRKASQLALEALTAALPEMLGGSADLTGSNLTNTKATPNLRVSATGEVVQTTDAAGATVGGRHINYGVREFGMAAIMNGIALHGGFIPYGGTFLTFSDYSRNAIRMAALMKLRVVHVFTHDSIGLGEDGPTHQSIEHAASLRLIPNLDVWRPADTAETAVAWAVALRNTARPTALLLSRQNISYAPKGHCDAAPDAAGLDAINKGAYVLAEPVEVGLRKRAQAVIIATGSEVQLALKAQELLAQRKIAVRVVSMPSTTTFDRQSACLQGRGTARRPAPRRGRDGCERRLVEIRLRGGGGHRHLRRVRACTGPVQAFRLHAGEPGRHRPEGAGQTLMPARPHTTFQPSEKQT
jgi:transketolase